MSSDDAFIRLFPLLFQKSYSSDYSSLIGHPGALGALKAG